MKSIFLFLFLIPVVAKAQFDRIDYGVAGGLNISNIKGEFSFKNSKNRTSFYFGGFAEVPVTGPLGIRSELLYSAVGAKTESLLSDVIWKLSYINIPIMAQYEVLESLNLMTGIQTGVLLSAKSKFESSNPELELSITDEYKTFDFSWVIGAEYRLEMGLGLNIRYNLGLTDTDDTGFVETKNRVFQIGASFLLSELINN